MATKKGKSPVVLLHGLGGTSVDWKDVAKSLAKGHDVFTPELPLSGVDPKGFAAWLAEWMETEGLAAAAVVGHSLGGRVAAELAATEPGRVTKLGLLSALGGAGYGLTDKLKWKAMSRASLVKAVPESQLRSALSVGFAGAGPAMKGFVDRAMAGRTGRNAGVTASFLEKSVDWVLASPPIAERLRGTSVPTLVMTGSDDPLSPPAESKAIAKAASAALALLPTGHYALLETPERVSDALRPFLAD